MLNKKLLLYLMLSFLVGACNASNQSNNINMTFEQVEKLRAEAENSHLDSDEKKKYYKDIKPIYEKLANEGNSDAQFILSDIYIRALDGDYDSKKSFEWAKKSADNGNVSAMYNTGTNYYVGRGVGKNIEKAKDYYLKAAKLNHVDAMGSIGEIYIEEGNIVDAIKYLEFAASKNDARSLFLLGLTYCDGKAVTQDYTKCSSYWEKAANLGNPEANLNFAINLESGIGAKQDIEKSIKYFKKSSDMGDAQASYNLGMIYSMKKYNRLDEERSQKYFKKAYEQGLEIALSKIK